MTTIDFYLWLLSAEYASDTLRIFLELATEGSIKDILTTFGPLSEPLVRRYTTQILCGLGFLHQKCFIHRDIKPSNLLIDKGIVKVADFGCSTGSRLDSEGRSSDGGHDTVIGTTVYMSPEMMRGDSQEFDNHVEITDKKGYGRKSDIWSLGITLCEMTTGHAPFRNGASAIYSVFVANELPVLPEHMSSDAHFFLSRCLVIDPEKRADCKELQGLRFCIPQTAVDMKVTVSQQSHLRTAASTVRFIPQETKFELTDINTELETDGYSDTDCDGLYGGISSMDGSRGHSSSIEDSKVAWEDKPTDRAIASSESFSKHINKDAKRHKYDNNDDGNNSNDSDLDSDRFSELFM